jgi:hypothetical protein
MSPHYQVLCPAIGLGVVVFFCAVEIFRAPVVRNFESINKLLDLFLAGASRPFNVDRCPAGELVHRDFELLSVGLI